MLENNAYFRLNVSSDEARLLLAILPLAAIESSLSERRIVRNLLGFKDDDIYNKALKSDDHLLELSLLLLYFLLLKNESSRSLKRVMNRVTFHDPNLESRIWMFIYPKEEPPISVEELESMWNSSSTI